MQEGFATAHRPRRTIRAAMMILGLSGLALATTTTITSLGWMGRTFPGFLLLEDRVVAAITLPDWSGSAEPDLFLRQVIAVNGVPTPSEAAVYESAAEAGPGKSLQYELRDGDSVRFVDLTTSIFTGSDWVLLFGSYLLNGVVFLLAGILAWSFQPTSPLARSFLLFSGTAAVYLFTAMDLYGPSTFMHLYLLANALLPATALDLALLFPTTHRFAAWRWLPYPVAGLVFVLYEVFLETPSASTAIFQINTIYLGVAGLFFGFRLLVAYFDHGAQLARQRVRIVLLGTLLGLTVPGIILITSSFLRTTLAMNVLLFAFFVFPLSLAYAIVAHDFFEIEAMVKRGATYLLATGAVGAAYVAAATTLNVVLQAGDVVHSAAFPVLFTVLVLVLFNPLHSRLQSVVDRVFFRTRYDGAEILAGVGAKLAATLDREEIARRVRASVDEAIPAEGVSVFLECDDGLRDAQGRTVPPVLLAALHRERILTRLDPLEMFADAEEHVAARSALAGLTSEIMVPMLFEEALVGALALGPKRSGLFYTAGDAEFLRALAQAATIALQNASSYAALQTLNEELEDRVQARTNELAEANQSLTRAYDDLSNAQVQLVQSEKLVSLGRLAAGVAHEINNPVSFISSNIGPLKEILDELAESLPEQASEPLEDAREFVDIMGRGAERTARIVSDLSQFSRLNEAERKEIDLSEGIDVTLRLLESRWRDRIQIHRNYEDLPLIECDAGQMNQVFMNLLANACDAIADTGNVWVTVSRRGDHFCFEIRDDGSGMTPSQAERVFEPFFTTKDVGAGTGLGLATVHGIVTAHDGHIEVETELGIGSTFRVRLPSRVRGRRK